MLMGNPFKLNATIGRSYTVEPKDVKRTKRALVDLDYLKPRFKDDKGKPMSPVDDTPSPDLFAGLEAFQKDHGLKVDGLMKPDGETAKTLTDKLAEKTKPASPKPPKPNPPADPFAITPKQAADSAKKAFAELDRRRRESVGPLEPAPKGELNNFLEPRAPEAAPQAAPPAPPRGPSMDERGNRYDADGTPIDPPPRDPNIVEAQAAAPIPGTGPMPPLPLPGTVFDPNSRANKDFVDRNWRAIKQLEPHYDRVQQGLSDALDGVTDGGWSALKNTLHGRTEADPEAGKPTVETFPAAPPNAGDGRTETPATPPAPPPHTGPAEAPPRLPDHTETPDQSDDLADPGIVDMRPFKSPIDLNKGDPVPQAIEAKASDGLTPSQWETFKGAAFGDGVMTERGTKAVNVETGRPASEARRDWESAVRAFGGDPFGEDVIIEHDKHIFPLPNGLHVLLRFGKDGRDTVSFSRQFLKNGKRVRYEVKRRYD